MKSINKFINEKLKIDKNTIESSLNKSWKDFLKIVFEYNKKHKYEPCDIRELTVCKTYGLPVIEDNDIFEIRIFNEHYLKRSLLSCGVFDNGDFVDYDVYSKERFLECINNGCKDITPEKYFNLLYDEIAENVHNRKA